MSELLGESHRAGKCLVCGAEWPKGGYRSELHPSGFSPFWHLPCPKCGSDSIPTKEQKKRFDKGFTTCLRCQGSGILEYGHCPHCKGTGFVKREE